MDGKRVMEESNSMSEGFELTDIEIIEVLPADTVFPCDLINSKVTPGVGNTDEGHPITVWSAEEGYTTEYIPLISKEGLEQLVLAAIKEIGYPLDFLHPWFDENNCSDGKEHYEILCFHDDFRMDNDYCNREAAYYVHDKYGVSINSNCRDEDNLVSLRDHGHMTQQEFMALMRERGYIE